MNKLLLNLRASYLTAIGEVLLALALLHRPHAGAVAVLWGEQAALFWAGMYLAGAVGALMSARLNGSDIAFIKRHTLYVLSTLPILGYSLATLYLFVFVRKLSSETVSLTNPITQLGVVAGLLAIYACESRCEESGGHDDS